MATTATSTPVREPFQLGIPKSAKYRVFCDCLSILLTQSVLLDQIALRDCRVDPGTDRALWTLACPLCRLHKETILAGIPCRSFVSLPAHASVRGATTEPPRRKVVAQGQTETTGKLVGGASSVA